MIKLIFLAGLILIALLSIPGLVQEWKKWKKWTAAKKKLDDDYAEQVHQWNQQMFDSMSGFMKTILGPRIQFNVVGQSLHFPLPHSHDPIDMLISAVDGNGYRLEWYPPKHGHPRSVIKLSCGEEVLEELESRDVLPSSAIVHYINYWKKTGGQGVRLSAFFRGDGEMFVGGWV